MKHCQRCNLNFPDNLKFCESCGGGLGEAISLRCAACGEKAQPGWKFCVKCQAPLPSSGTGNLANAIERSTLPPTVPLVSPDPSPTAPLHEDETTRSSQPGAISDAQIRVRCRSCRKLVDEDSEFCEYCGTSVYGETAPSIFPPTPPPPTQQFTSQQTYGRDTVYQAANESETTSVRPKPDASAGASAPTEITAERTAPSLSGFESYGQSSRTRQFKWWHGLLVVLFIFAVFGALGAGGWYLWIRQSSAEQASAQPASDTDPSLSSSSTSTSPTAGGQTGGTQSADDELKQVRAQRAGAAPADADKIVAAAEAAEKKYPTDYRFPYERAKLSIKGMISHHEAFEAIFLAGEKAIDNGKAQEMLNDLMSDKDGDFYKMSRGHREWTVLEEALKNKDKSGLEKHDE